MARGSGNRGSGGARGRANYGRAFKVHGKKRRKPGRPRKARRALTAAFIGVPPKLRPAPAPEPDPVDAIEEDLRAEETAQKEQKNDI